MDDLKALLCETSFMEVINSYFVELFLNLNPAFRLLVSQIKHELKKLQTNFSKQSLIYTLQLK